MFEKGHHTTACSSDLCKSIVEEQECSEHCLHNITQLIHGVVWTMAKLSNVM